MSLLFQRTGATTDKFLVFTFLAPLHVATFSPNNKEEQVKWVMS